MNTFQDLIFHLQDYWAKQGCVILQPLDLEVGAGTFHPATFLRAVGPEPWYAAYVQPCRRPTDGRYGENPNRVQHYYQFQVALKPSPDNIQELYLGSLRHIGIDPAIHDIRFVEDNWESPTLGAWGLGWEVWQNGMEISQYTYFQQVGGIPCKPVLGELTYGLERLAMGLFGVDNIFDIPWAITPLGRTITYGDVFLQNEIEMSTYNFEQANVEECFSLFDYYEKESLRLIQNQLPLPAYEMMTKASHTFNLLDARHAISVTERQGYILRVRALSRAIAQAYFETREQLGFPLLEKTSGKHKFIHDKFTPVENSNNDTHDFFLEIGCEELPPNSLLSLSEALKENLKQECIEANLGEHLKHHPQHMHVYAAPRRLAILIKHLPEKTAVKTREEHGPPVSVAYDAEGKPTAAAIGFAKKQGVSVEQLERVITDKGECIVLNKIIPAQNTIELLPGIVEHAIAKLPIAKPMHWGNHDTVFARPVHWIVMIYGHTLIQTEILGCQTSQTTLGHRVHHPEPILLEVAGAYSEKLKTAFVIADFDERKNLLKKQLKKHATELNAEIVCSDELLNEVTGLVEWPVVLTIPFDGRFLELPKEILITAMQHHQKSFALISKEKLIPFFLTAANIDSIDSEQVIAGNQRVMQARLSDAAFFYEKDQKVKLESRRDFTKQVIFQAKLGTLYDKSERLIQLAVYLAPFFSADISEATRSAYLSQCDLMTDIVGEFPELQGVMGYYYALIDGESKSIAQSLNEQYWPRFSGDQLPETPLGTVLSIAERVDTLIGAFSINQKPTGNKDPFKLRRHALGLIRILIAHPNDLDLMILLAHALKNYPNPLNPKTVEETHLFILERLKAYYYEQGYDLMLIQAVLARQSTQLHDFDLRLKAMHTFSTWDEAAALSAANKRVSRILEQAQLDDTTIQQEYLEPAEKNLVDALNAQQSILHPLLEKKQYTEALKNLATLRQPIDVFFDNIMVNTEDAVLRQNRLSILNALRQLFLKIADLSCLN